MADKTKLLNDAQKHLTKGNLDKAIKAFQDIIAIDPRDHRISLRLADLLARAGRKKEAIDQYVKVAAVYIKDDFTPHAIAVYKTILRLDPELLSAYEKLSELYKSQGLEAEALSNLENLFGLYEKKKDENKQIEVLKLMVEMDPENLGFQVRLGETLARKGRKQEAAEAFAKSASTLSRRGFHDRASTMFEKITALDPGNVVVRKELCSHYLESGQYEKAQREIEAILKVDPDDARMTLLLGRIHLMLGDRRQGEAQVSRSISLFKESGEFDDVIREYLFVAQTHLRNKELPEAEVFYRNIHRVAPQELHAIKGLIALAEANGDEEGQVEGLLSLARALEARGDASSCVEALGRVLRIRPGHPEAAELLASQEAAAEADVHKDLQAETEEPLETIEVEEPLEEIAGELGVDLLGAGEGAAEAQESPGGEQALEFEGSPMAAEQIPEIILDDFEAEQAQEAEPLMGQEPEPFVAAEAPRPEGIGPAPVQAPPTQELPLEDLLVEVDVYSRYGLGEKVREILEGARKRFGSDPRVLSRTAQAAIEGKWPDAGAACREWIQGLLISGDVQAARDAYRTASAALPSDRELAAFADRLGPVVKPVPTAPQAQVSSAPEPARPGKTPVPKPSPAPPLKTPSAEAFAEDLEEAEFYLSQGLEDEAARIYGAILQKSPGHPAASKAMASLKGEGEGRRAAPAAAATPAAPPQALEQPVSPEIKGRLIVEDSTPEVGGFLDLADELRTELAEEFNEPAAQRDEGPVTFEEVFAEFKKGIAQTLGQEEYETHYNLGIAYKDMGLFDDAIREFETSAGDPKLVQDSLSLMAVCFLEKDDPASAVKALQKALAGATPTGKAGLLYQLGECYAHMKDWGQALEFFHQVKAIDVSFEGIDQAMDRVRRFMTTPEPKGKPRDGGMDDMLADLIREVEQMAQESSGAKPDPGAPPSKPKKDRISYL